MQVHWPPSPSSLQLLNSCWRFNASPLYCECCLGLRDFSFFFSFLLQEKVLLSSAKGYSRILHCGCCKRLDLQLLSFWDSFMTATERVPFNVLFTKLFLNGFFVGICMNSNNGGWKNRLIFFFYCHYRLFVMHWWFFTLSNSYNV